MRISDTVKLVVLGITLLFIMAAPWIWPNHHVTVLYDCRIAEISPDVPLAVKEQCRRKLEK